MGSYVGSLRVGTAGKVQPGCVRGVETKAESALGPQKLRMGQHGAGALRSAADESSLGTER